jgi:hypothetical protein
MSHKLYAPSSRRKHEHMLRRIFPINTAHFSTFINNYQKMTRYVEKKVLSIEQSEGVGARVRRSIGTSQVCRF